MCAPKVRKRPGKGCQNSSHKVNCPFSCACIRYSYSAKAFMPSPKKPKRKGVEKNREPEAPPLKRAEIQELAAQNRTAHKLKGLLETRWSGFSQKIPTLESLKRAVAELGYNPRAIFDSLEPSSEGKCSRIFLSNFQKNS